MTYAYEFCERLRRTLLPSHPEIRTPKNFLPTYRARPKSANFAWSRHLAKPMSLKIPCLAKPEEFQVLAG